MLKYIIIIIPLALLSFGLVTACVLMEMSENERIRFAYRLINSAPTIKTKSVKYYDDEEQVWKIGEVIVDE